MMENKNNNNEIQILNFDAGSSAKGNTKVKWYPIDLNVEVPPSPDYSQVCGDGCHVATGGVGEIQAVGDVEVEERALDSIPNDEEAVNVVNSEILKAKKGKMPMICSEVGDAAVVVEGVNGVAVAVDEGSVNQVNMMLRRRDDVANGSNLERKRKRDFSEYYIPPSSRLCRGPKAVVRVESSYDYVEDGYRWRKYGKKAIKGSPNPRGYFRCATQGCNVRKQVERDICNPRFVISTYEGKHKHPLPTSKFKFTNSTIAAALSLPIKTTSTGNATNNIPIFPPQQPSPMPFSLHHRYSHATPINNNYLWRPNYHNFFNYANNTIRPHTSGLNYHHPYAIAATATTTTATARHGPIIGGSVNRGLPPLDRAPDFLQLGGYGVRGAPAAQLHLN